MADEEGEDQVCVSRGRSSSERASRAERSEDGGVDSLLELHLSPLPIYRRIQIRIFIESEPLE